MNEEIKVSICCLTYNHEKFINDTLKGFVSQKTSFKYEVLIHDDASTDGTAGIIREYEEKYPHIIKPIYQAENQYSKGIKISMTYNFSRAKGKYIAMCEGDDFWIDEFKLEKQINYMEEHRKCMFCFTNGQILDMANQGTIKKFIPQDIESKKIYNLTKKDYNVGEVARLGFIPTASFVFRTECIDMFPSYYDDLCPAGDMKYKLYCTAMGYAHFIDDETCVYRMNVSGSAMTNWGNLKKENRRELYSSFVQLIDNVDRFSEYRYSIDLAICKKPYYKKLLMCAKDRTILSNSMYKEVYQELTTIEKIRFWSELLFPEKLILYVKRIIRHH